jgi:hypothetical protein
MMLVAAVVAGCASRSKPQTQVQAAYVAGQQQALRQMQSDQKTVTVLGEVRNPVVPWKEDLTLAKAILEAQYRGFQDPREIVIIRQGETFRVKTRHFLAGGDDLPLEPGDVIRLER